MFENSTLVGNGKLALTLMHDYSWAATIGTCLHYIYWPSISHNVYPHGILFLPFRYQTILLTSDNCPILYDALLSIAL